MMKPRSLPTSRGPGGPPLSREATGRAAQHERWLCQVLVGPVSVRGQVYTVGQTVLIDEPGARNLITQGRVTRVP